MTGCLPKGWINRLAAISLLVIIIIEQTVQAKIIIISTNHFNREAKTDEFSEKFQKEGTISDPKI